jgi:hypothetical protein
MARQHSQPDQQQDQLDGSRPPVFELIGRVGAIDVSNQVARCDLRRFPSCVQFPERPARTPDG